MRGEIFTSSFLGLFFETVFIRLLEPKKAMRTRGWVKKKGFSVYKKLTLNFFNPFQQERKGFVLHYEREWLRKFFLKGWKG